jgi:predicted nucleic acid-binding protein
LKIVLNEFIIDRAVGSPHDRATVLMLLEKIKNNQSVKILLSPDIIKIYYQKAKAVENQLRECPKVIKSFMLLIQDYEKAPVKSQLPNIELPANLEHDRLIIATAAAWQTDKLLVTTDQDLIRLLQEVSITATYHIEALTPEDVVERL